MEYYYLKPVFMAETILSYILELRNPDEILNERLQEKQQWLSRVGVYYNYFDHSIFTLSY